MDLLVVVVMRAPYGPIAKPDRTQETFLNYSHPSFFADERNESSAWERCTYGTRSRKFGQLGSAHMAERVLVTKLGLDGHDRGVKIVARILRDAGYEVIYTGLFQTPETVVAAAIDEDVSAIGVSMLSGAHEALLPMVTQALADAGAQIPVILGGIVPETDFQSMYDVGVARVLTPGATAEEVVEAVRGAIEEARVN